MTSIINNFKKLGRVHSAFVAGINYDQKTATVEWFEHSESKGKEIEFSLIETLNPEIQIKTLGENYIEQTAPETVLQQPIVNNFQRDSSSSEEEEISAAMPRPTYYGHKFEVGDEDFNSNQVSPDTTTILGHSRKTDFPIAPASNAIRIKRGTSQQIHTINNGHMTTSEIQPSKEIPTNYPINKSLSTVISRRTNVVKEVEKLKKNREERRMRQAEEKAEKEAFLQMAPGNPHWELSNMISEYRRTVNLAPFTDNYSIEDHLITVCVRKRPLNKKEASRKEVDVITILSKDQLVVHEPKNKVDLTKYLENQAFRFDYAFDEHCSNEVVYKYSAQPLVKTIFEGGFATCFAYGQTGSGKTYTMGGFFNGRNQEKGIYALAANDVFQLANSPKYRQSKFVVSASFFEIYSGKVFDLLTNKAKLRVLEDGKQQVQIVGLAEKVVSSVDEILKLIHKGNQARTSGQTSANTNSSRSHAIFQLILRNSNVMHKVYGKFSLIDLAGNERGADTSSADRQTRMEGAEINKSLLALKECIRALGRRGAHLPFRVSKLTLVLKDSFVGANSRTCMIAMISPGISSCEHTLNTLRYADRVKELGSVDTMSNQIYDNDTVPNKPDEEDLLHLQSLNEKDMTPELLNFHQMISELQVAEDVMIDNHKQSLEHFLETTKQIQQLLRMTDDVEYNQEGMYTLSL